jgi:phage shock protein A
MVVMRWACRRLGGFVLAFRRLEKIASLAASEALAPSVFVKFSAEDAGELAKAAERHLAKLAEVVEKVKTSIEDFEKKVEDGKAG